jgi:hypothetical protein
LIIRSGKEPAATGDDAMNATAIKKAAEILTADLNAHDYILMALMRHYMIAHVEINDGDILMLSPNRCNTPGMTVKIARNSAGVWAWNWN